MREPTQIVSMMMMVIILMVMIIYDAEEERFSWELVHKIRISGLGHGGPGGSVGGLISVCVPLCWSNPSLTLCSLSHIEGDEDFPRALLCHSPDRQGFFLAPAS